MRINVCFSRKCLPTEKVGRCVLVFLGALMIEVPSSEANISYIIPFSFKFISNREDLTLSYKPTTPHNSSIRTDEGLRLETSAF